MVSRDELKGKWNIVKGRLQEHWGQLTEDDFRRIEGGAERLVGAIQQKTGATRREIERFLDQCVQEAGGVSALTREYADQAAAALQDSYRRATDSTNELARRLSTTVARRPLEALAVALAVGLVAGCLYATSRRR